MTVRKERQLENILTVIKKKVLESESVSVFDMKMVLEYYGIGLSGACSRHQDPSLGINQAKFRPYRGPYFQALLERLHCKKIFGGFRCM